MVAYIKLKHNPKHNTNLAYNGCFAIYDDCLWYNGIIKVARWLQSSITITADSLMILSAHKVLA